MKNQIYLTTKALNNSHASWHPLFLRLVETRYEAELPKEERKNGVSFTIPCDHLSQASTESIEATTNMDRVLDIQLLYLIFKGPMSGYDLRRKMQSHFHVRLSYGTIYPHLRKFEREGLVSGAWSPRTVGSKKNMYMITEKGRGTLRKILGEFQALGKEIGI